MIGGDDPVPIPMIEAMAAQADGLLSCRLMPILTGAICIWVSGLAVFDHETRSEMGYIDNIIGRRSGIGSAHQDDYRCAGMGRTIFYR